MSVDLVSRPHGGDVVGQLSQDEFAALVAGLDVAASGQSLGDHVYGGDGDPDWARAMQKCAACFDGACGWLATHLYVLPLFFVLPFTAGRWIVNGAPPLTRLAEWSQIAGVAISLCTFVLMLARDRR
jgi:hypothetical protein